MRSVAEGMVKQVNEVTQEMVNSYIMSTGVRCVEKDFLEEGLIGEQKYIDEYIGENVNRSEARLYTLYGAVGRVLAHHGKVDIKAQGINGVRKKDLTVQWDGNTYDGIKPKMQVSTDLTYRNVWDSKNVIRGIEIRNGSKNLKKNINNNARALTGESKHFNDIIRSKSNITGKYFTSITFIDKNNVNFNNVVASMLAQYETGEEVAVVPFEKKNGKITVLLGAVPKEIQLMSMLREC